MTISFNSRGSFKNLESYLKKMSDLQVRSLVEPYAREGVRALAAATPVATGKTASSWDYKIEVSRGRVKIIWINTDQENGFPVAIALQHGHGTGTGGYVQGRDYINPAMKPIFDRISDGVRKAVSSR